MIFLQPFILWGLPLVLLPIVIHLLNRLRYRSVDWGAMAFLRRATRQSTRHSRLRQWLLLGLRVLAILCLILALSRPLAGGWIGASVGGAPETVIVLLDRSASMAGSATAGGPSRLERASRLLVRAAGQTPGARWVLIDNVSSQAQALSSPAQLSEAPLTQGSDTAADLPGMLEIAAQYMQENRTGLTELWIASDLQLSNWRGSDERWSMLRARFGNLPQPPRIRLLALDSASPGNAAIRITDATTSWQDGYRYLNLGIRLQGEDLAGRQIPVRLSLNGSDTTLLLEPSGKQLTVQEMLPLGESRDGGWGFVSLPADTNERDNRAWFAYGAESVRETLILATDEQAAAHLQLAATPLKEDPLRRARGLQSSDLSSADLEGASLLIVQGVSLNAVEGEMIRQWLESGGAMLAFPGESDTGAVLNLVSWGDIEEATAAEGYAVRQPARAVGPLRPAASGEPLPLDELEVWRRCRIGMEGEVLAAFADEEVPLFMRRSYELGQIVAGATVPSEAWSTLGRGPVLVPLVQRLLAEGSKRQAKVAQGATGPGTADLYAGPWQALDRPGDGSDPRTHAGIYRAGEMTVAVNRPAAEDSWYTLDGAEARAYFGTLSARVFDDGGGGGQGLQSEVWRGFLMVMLLLLVGESMLTLPGTAQRRSGA